jgi:hypothetical protein
MRVHLTGKRLQHSPWRGGIGFSSTNAEHPEPAGGGLHGPGRVPRVPHRGLPVLPQLLDH